MSTGINHFDHTSFPPFSAVERGIQRQIGVFPSFPYLCICYGSSERIGHFFPSSFPPLSGSCFAQGTFSFFFCRSTTDPIPNPRRPPPLWNPVQGFLLFFPLPAPGVTTPFFFLSSRVKKKNLLPPLFPLPWKSDRTESLLPFSREWNGVSFPGH